MADAIPVLPGLKEGGSDDRGLYLKVFAGEVLTAFHENVVMRDKHFVREITKGKSAQFPAIWRAKARYHQRGKEITGQNIPHTDVIVELDDLLISDTFIADIDEMLNHYDLRQPYAQELGHALALEFDRNVARTVILSARSGPLFTADQGGTQLVNAAYDTDANALLDGISDAKLAMENKLVPVAVQRVYAGFMPTHYNLIARSDKALNRDFNGGQLSLQGGVLRTVDDVFIVKSTGFPFGRDETPYNASTNPDGLLGHPTDPRADEVADLKAKYQGDWTNTIGIVWTPFAAATVQRMDVRTESAWDIRRQGTLMLAKMFVGHGILRSKCAVELAKA